MDPNQFNFNPPPQQQPNDSAILFLGETDPFGQQPFVVPSAPPAPPATSATNVALSGFATNSSGSGSGSQSSPQDGHQILDQVQKELQFLPSNNENAYVSGMISGGGGVGGGAPPLPPKSGMLSGSMDQVGSTGDTDFLIGTDPISLGSPIGSEVSAANQNTKYSIWQFDYYAKFFELSTDIFFRRILWSLLPLTGDNKGTYIERHIQANPDLFGPFWISLTLAFTVTICDNIVTYLNQFHDIAGPIGTSTTCVPGPNCTAPVIPSPTPPPHYHHLAFTFDRMHLSMLITFSYVFLAPLVLWSFCQWRQCSKLYNFLECLCAYGYSLSIFIPVAVASLVNIRELQFILFASAAFLSGSVLLISFAPVVHSDPNRSIKIAYIMMIFILVAHFVLALFYLYIFL